jgi:putative PIN family toxin of toxin-antitoxin system
VRLVLDTNTVVSALLWHGPPHQLFTRSRAFSLAFFSSPALLTKLEEVLAYPKLAKAVAASGLTPAQLLQRYLRLATVVQPTPIAPTVLADPDDDHVLACALAAKAELIVSGDRHLLGLHEYQGIPILNTSDALQRLEAKSTG